MASQNFIARPALAVYNTGTSGPIPITGTLLHTIDNPNAYGNTTEDLFGYSVAVSGDYAIVGAYLEDGSFSEQEAGKAYIFDVTTGSLVHTLDNPNTETAAYSWFGHSVAISNNYAIVGAYRTDPSSGGLRQGKAYIFDVTTGSLVHALDNPNAAALSTSNDYFGYSVGISGNYAIAGAFLEDDGDGSVENSSGKAYIFDVTTGNLLHTLDNPNANITSASDYFGYSVAVSGDYAIVGAYREYDVGGSDSGKAYIFDVTTGNLLHTLDNPNAYSTSAGDRFGWCVSISNEYAIVGAYREDDIGGSDSGKAYIFDVTTGNLLHTLDNPNAYGTSASDRFGYSVSISGDNAVIGAYLENDGGGIDSGKAYIFDVTTGNLLHTLDNPNAYGTSVTDNFGLSVSINGNSVIVGAHLEDDAGGTSSGKVYIYN